MALPPENEPELIINNNQSHRNQPEVDPAAPAKKFRAQGVKFFLTFPQCNLSKDLALNRVLFKYPELKWIIVAEEKHLDGSPHLHLVFWLKKKIRYSDPKFWDFVGSKHGNYQTVRNVVKVIKYVTKGNEFVTHGIDVETYLKSKRSKKGSTYELAAKLVREGKSLEDLEEEHPALVLQHLKKLQDYQQFLKRKKRKLAGLKLTPWTPIPILNIHQDFRSMGNWMNKNLGSPRKRPFKAKQLWIYGKTNLGKTSLAITLKKYFRVYVVPLDSRNLDDYEDDEYDLIIFDEYKGQKSITWLNGFVQGFSFPVHRRYNSTLKEVNLPVIVLSEYSIEQAYSKVHMFNPARLDAVRGRFQVEHVTKFINVNI